MHPDTAWPRSAARRSSTSSTSSAARHRQCRAAQSFNPTRRTTTSAAASARSATASSTFDIRHELRVRSRRRARDVRRPRRAQQHDFRQYDHERRRRRSLHPLSGVAEGEQQHDHEQCRAKRWRHSLQREQRIAAEHDRRRQPASDATESRARARSRSPARQPDRPRRDRDHAADRYARCGRSGLQPLAYNGGPTRTHALRLDSIAIDAGNNAADLPSDQRGPGFARVVGTAADIGAFEFDARAGDGTARIPVRHCRNGASRFCVRALPHSACARHETTSERGLNPRDAYVASQRDSDRRLTPREPGYRYLRAP